MQQLNYLWTEQTSLFHTKSLDYGRVAYKESYKYVALLSHSRIQVKAGILRDEKHSLRTYKLRCTAVIKGLY